MKSDSFGASDILPLVRRDEITWGKDVYAVPFGTAQFVIVYRPDRFRAGQAAAPPETWDRFSDWLDRFESPEKKIAAPMIADWAGHVLLARSSAYARKSGQVSTVFDFRTLAPLINQPPFARALKEIASQHKNDLESTIESIVGDLTSGRTPVAILHWHAIERLGDADSDEIQLHFARLPGSRSAFSFSEKAWSERRQGMSTRVPYVGFSGRLGSVLRGSRRQRAAWSMLLQLSASGAGTRVSASSNSTGPYRLSQLEEASAWTGRGVDASATRDYAAVYRSALTSHISMRALRLPGQNDYMAVLSQAVRDVVAESAEAQPALDAVAEEWRAIHERLGVESQIAAYSESLGIDP